MKRDLVELLGYALILLAIGLVWLPAAMVAAGLLLVIVANYVMTGEPAGERQEATAAPPVATVEEARERVATLIVGAETPVAESAPQQPWWHRRPLKPNVASAAKSAPPPPAAPPAMLLHEYANLSPLERAIANERARAGQRIA